MVISYRRAAFAYGAFNVKYSYVISLGISSRYVSSGSGQSSFAYAFYRFTDTGNAGTHQVYDKYHYEGNYKKDLEP